MFCPNCGKMTDGNAKFCSACGTRLSQAQEQFLVMPEDETVMAPATDSGYFDAEEATQIADQSDLESTEFADNFDNQGFTLPDEGNAADDYVYRANSEEGYGDFDKTELYVRPPYEYSGDSETQPYDNARQKQEIPAYIPENVYAPQQEYLPDYGLMNAQGYQNPSYGPNYYQNNPVQEPEKKKLSAASIVMIVAAIIVAIIIGGGAAVIQTQYGGFDGFISSFGKSEKDEDDEEKKNTEKDNESKEEVTSQVTTIPETTTLPVTEPTTTLPPTTQTQPPRIGDGYCGTNLQYTFNSVTGELVVFGKGKMYDYTSDAAPWETYNVKRIIFEEGVESVTEGSLAYLYPEYIYISSTVSDFDIFSLDHFSEIVVSPQNPYYMSKDGVLFNKDGSVLICYPNKSTRSVYVIPDSVKWIGPYAFFDADNLTSVTIGPNVQYIDEYAFKSCNGFRYFTIPATVKEIETGAFYNWDSSQEIYFASGSVQVADDWNEGCNAKITIAE